MLELIEQVVRRATAGEPVAVCVVAHTRGSTPQKAGAAMLVLQHGQTLGTLGGGCVEAEVRTRALQLMHDRQSRLLTFRLDHDYGWDDGLVCGGVMEIAVQIVASAQQAEPWRAAADELRAGHDANVALNVVNEASEYRAITHSIEPPPTLIIAGAGHVGMALAAVAHTLEFQIIVIDDRADCASAERFPQAKRIIGDIEHELRRVPLHGHAYVVIVTRGHRHDATALAAVIDSPAKYVGLIGSRRKVVTILQSLRDSGVSAERMAHVHSPIGLDIGAVTPGEIAVSIAAELVAVRRGVDPTVVHTMKLSDKHLRRIVAGSAEPTPGREVVDAHA